MSSELKLPRVSCKLLQEGIVVKITASVIFTAQIFPYSFPKVGQSLYFEALTAKYHCDERLGQIDVSVRLTTHIKLAAFAPVRPY